jgi:uncharacterized protein
MAKIPQGIREFLTSYLSFVATADSKGVPNVVPKGNLAVLDDNHLVFADLYSLQTRKNLKGNPQIAITVVNPAGYAGYQIKGRAEVIERGKEYDRLSGKVMGLGQLNHPDAKYAVKVRVDRVANIGYVNPAGR